MSARKKPVNDIDAEVIDSTDLAPLELDPPDPALARWQELADRMTAIRHAGDAERVMPFPRPAWADEDYDVIGTSVPSSLYRSRSVEVAARWFGGSDDDVFTPSIIAVHGKVDGDGIRSIGVTSRRTVDRKWQDFAMSLSVAGALELAGVLRAAVDLLGGER